MLTTFLIIALPFTIGVVLIRLGLRGVRVDDHPICRRCGFDLFGQSGAIVCNECGRLIVKPRSIVVGRRQRRTKIFTAGLLVLMTALIGGGILSWHRAKNVNWWNYAPLWWVLREASASNRKMQIPALAELILRSRSTAISQQQLNRILDAGLAYQGNLSKPWEPGWGAVIEYANDGGRLSADRRELYARQCCKEPAKFWITGYIGDGQTAKWHVEVPVPRLARYSDLFENISWDGPDVPDDPPLPGEWGRCGGVGKFSPLAFDGVICVQRIDMPFTMLHAVPPGFIKSSSGCTRKMYKSGRFKSMPDFESDEDMTAKFEVR